MKNFTSQFLKAVIAGYASLLIYACKKEYFDEVFFW